MKAKVVFAAIILLVCTVSIKAETTKGNGKLVTKTITVSDYDQIEVGGNIGANGLSSISSLFSGSNNQPVYVFNYKQADGDAALEVTVDENIFPLLKITTSNGKLTINTLKQNDRLAPTKLTINGKSKNLRSLRASGSIDFILQTPLKGDKLELVLSGASDVVMKQPVRIEDCSIRISGSSDLTADQLTCSNIQAEVSGSGDANLGGTANEGKYRVSGSGDIKAYNLVVKKLDCAVSGSGDIQANASETLRASASGSGDVKYKGNATATTSTSGGGDVTKVN